MISNPHVFDTSDSEVIDVLKAEGLAPDVWADERVTLIKKQAKNHYIRQQSFRCCYCDERSATMNNRVWDLEHIVPKAVHPRFMFEPRNLAVSCPDCNNAKSDKETLVDPSLANFPGQAESFKVVHPHFDEWNSHIRRRGLVFTPLTDRGTWTVKECNLGRFALLHIDPSDNSNPSDVRFEEAVNELTADPATAKAARDLIEAYLSHLPEEPLA